MRERCVADEVEEWHGDLGVEGYVQHGCRGESRMCCCAATASTRAER